MKLGEIVGLLVIAWIGYMIVSYFLNHFLGRNDASAIANAARSSPKRADETPQERTAPEDISRTWFRTLEVRESATLDEVSLAYRRKITHYHPDKVASLGPELQQLAETNSKQLNEAYADAKKSR